MEYVGTDVHKQSFQAAIIDEEGSLLEEFRIRNNRDGIQQLIEVAIVPAYPLIRSAVRSVVWNSTGGRR